MSMTKEQVLAVLASATESLRAEIESRRAGELPRRIERDLREVDELDQARAAIASWPEPATNPADVVTVPRAELHRIASQIRECADEGDGGGLQKLADELETHGDAAPVKPGEAVAWLYESTDAWSTRERVTIARHITEADPKDENQYWRPVAPLYTAPPSMAALTNPKDSDAEASLRALLAELRGLAERWMSADTNSYKHCSRALNAVLSRYPEAK